MSTGTSWYDDVRLELLSTNSTKLSVTIDAVETGEPPSGQPAEQAWTEVLTAGMSLLDKLGQALATGAKSASGGGSPGSLVSHDQQTGQSYLKLPMPEPETVQKIVDLFGALTKGEIAR